MRTLIVSLVAVMLTAGAAAAQTPAARVGPFSLSAEALVWWFKDSPMPVPLVTDGIIGQPGTRVLLGNSDIDTGAHPGFRLTADYAVTERWGVNASFFYLLPRTARDSVSSSGELGSTDLIIPFLDPTTNREDGTELSFSPIYSGTAKQKLENRLLGADLSGTWTAVPSGPVRLDVLAGFRYLRLREEWTFKTSSPFIPPFPQDVWTTKDEIDTTNNFYGAQLGVRGRADWGRFFLTGVVKFAMGAMVQSADVSGSLVTNDFTNFGPTQTFPGGYFALPTNSGDHQRTVFAVVPEVGLTLGYQITPWASVVAGYSFLYTNNVARPGNQINRTINPTQSVSWTGEPPATLVGPAQPSFRFDGSDFWAQGVNVGLNVRF